MDANQLRELATDAQLDHWPPHLGVTTDAEKVEYLAQRLSEVADAEDRADEAADQLTTAQEEIAGLEDENRDLNAQVETLKSDIKRYENKIQAIRELL